MANQNREEHMIEVKRTEYGDWIARYETRGGWEETPSWYMTRRGAVRDALRFVKKYHASGDWETA